MSRVSAKMLFLAGLLVIPAFLFQSNLPIKGAQTGAFIVLCLFFRRKMLIFPPAIAFLSVTIMNLLSPHGEILMTIGSFPVTRQALNTGLNKALTLIGLLYLSKLVITKQTPLPGTIGTLISRTFYFFEGMMEQWKGIREKQLLVKLDVLLLKLESTPDIRKEEHHSREYSRSVSLAFAIAFAGINWALLTFVWF